MVRVDGVLLDIPDAQRGFAQYTSEQRANHAASHRLGFRQKERVGHAFWTHPLRPGVCFPTRAAALRAAVVASARARRSIAP